jgi:hypothetical protein
MSEISKGGPVETVVKIHNSGKALYARIGKENRNLFSRGDKVKIILIEKANLDDEDRITRAISDYFDHPRGGDKLSGTIGGFCVSFPAMKLLKLLPRKKAEKVLKEIIMGE